jgi:hypothetical protein
MSDEPNLNGGGSSVHLPGMRPVAADCARGVLRLWRQTEIAGLAEFTLSPGMRLDLAGLTPSGAVIGIEIKSSKADFLADRKWRSYRAWCDLFYFAVPPGFDAELLPADEGLIVADRFGAGIVRESAVQTLAPARRKALTLRFARTAAVRIAAALDPLMGFEV